MICRFNDDSKLAIPNISLENWFTSVVILLVVDRAKASWTLLACPQLFQPITTVGLEPDILHYSNYRTTNSFLHHFLFRDPEPNSTSVMRGMYSIASAGSTIHETPYHPSLMRESVTQSDSRIDQENNPKYWSSQEVHMRSLRICKPKILVLGFLYYGIFIPLFRTEGSFNNKTSCRPWNPMHYR